MYITINHYYRVFIPNRTYLILNRTLRDENPVYPDSLRASNMNVDKQNGVITHDIRWRKFCSLAKQSIWKLNCEDYTMVFNKYYGKSATLGTPSIQGFSIKMEFLSIKMEKYK
ncbi:hypothetical protein RF11_01827 [Thelohanellus kitauei]|uniref:Uncharacterized protein n=1 Tax=Thelohanellus kitauei TaxID=669202 RepID=A0A0C2MN78_THEKT|nr:hypothetical protein RF11_01827 [Thelohanellus kitauei]